MEQVWRDYGDRNVQVVAVDFWRGSAVLVRGFAHDVGATYPVLLGGVYLSGSTQYGIAYDNYIVIDAQGVVRYTSVNEIFTGLGRWNDAAVRAVVDQWLPTAVEQASWSAVKALFADAP